MAAPRAFSAAASAIVRRPVLALLVSAAVLAPLLAASARVRPNNSLDAWFVEGDPALAQYHAFLREYGNDEAILVGFDTPAGARSDTEIVLQRRVAARIAGVDGIERVLAGAELPPPLAGGVVGADGRAAAVVAWLAVRPDIEQARGRIITEVREAARAELAPSGRVPHLAGNGVLYEGLNQQTIRDTGVFLTLSIIAMVVILALGLRSIRALAIALAGPLVAAGAGIGVQELAGRPFTVVGSALPTLILVIALADAIHVLLHYEAVRRDAPPVDEGARKTQAAAAVAWMAVPCFFTALTTSAGFLALATSRIALVRDFGIFAAVGMLLAWLVTMVFLAAALSLWDVRPPRRSAGGGFLQRWLDRTAVAVPRLRLHVVGTAVVLAAILGLGARRLTVDTDTIGLLPAAHEVRRDSDWLERRLGAYTPLEMRVTSDGAADDPAFRERLLAWRRAAAGIPRVERTFSGIDLAGTPAAAPGGGYVSEDGRSVRVTAYVPMMTSDGLASAATALEREGSRIFGRDDAVHATGYLPLYVRISDYVVQSTISGLFLSFVLVFVLMALLIRSPAGMAAAIPVNVLPVLLVFGVMGWAGIPLDLATATVGTIVLGIVVDDTIHFLHRYQEERRAGQPSVAAARESMRDAGRSIVLTSAVLTFGFGVMIAAGTKSIAWFGLVATLAIIGALFADLILLPALLALGARSEPHTQAPTARVPETADA